MRHLVGLLARDTVYGFEEVDRFCVYASCYADSDCCNNTVAVVVVVAGIGESAVHIITHPKPR